MNNKFYCYSYQLKNFLKLRNVPYITTKTVKNGNTCWIYKRDAEFNKHLDAWNKYKEIFCNNK